MTAKTIEQELTAESGIGPGELDPIKNPDALLFAARHLAATDPEKYRRWLKSEYGRACVEQLGDVLPNVPEDG